VSQNLQRRYLPYGQDESGSYEDNMFDVNVVSADRERHYSVAPAGAAGWEIKVEEDRSIRSREIYDDWHRVERMIARLQREVSELLDSGWRIQPASR
jgi:hypothetical protein